MTIKKACTSVPLIAEKIYANNYMTPQTQPISQRTRSRRVMMQESDDSGVLRITLRSSVRGLGGLIISIPTWGLSDEALSSIGSDETESFSGTITTFTEEESEDPTLPIPSDEIPLHVIKQSDLCGDDCSICLEPFKIRQHARKLCCTHTFHKKCIDRWLLKSRVCPCCRTDLSKKEVAPNRVNNRRFFLRSTRV